MRRGTQGHVAEPREPTRRLGGTKEARMRGRGHASPCGRPRGRHVARGGWHLKGPRVSGPWLGVWGGNANALYRPTYYTHTFLFFSSVCDYVPASFIFCRQCGSTMDVRCDCYKRRSVDSVDPSPRDHYQCTCVNRHLSEHDRRPADTWINQESPIFIGRAK